MYKKISELSIPVPWGYIRAKVWGDERDEIILVLHGKLDNAGSFDRLIPLLPNGYRYICFDLPSHGKSSPLPPFLPIHTLDYLVVCKIIVTYFQKPSYIFLGHSFGAILSQMFARFYPQYVKKLIMIDGIILKPIEVTDVKQALLTTVDGVIKIHEKTILGKKPSYSYEQALKRTQESRESGYLANEEAAVLLNRGLEPMGDDKFAFTVDQRMKVYLDPFHDMRSIMESFRNDPIQCPVLIILAKNTLPVIKETHKILEIINTWKHAIVKFVDGTHDVHITNPERIAPFVINFLIKLESKI